MCIRTVPVVSVSDLYPVVYHFKCVLRTFFLKFLIFPQDKDDIYSLLLSSLFFDLFCLKKQLRNINLEYLCNSVLNNYSTQNQWFNNYGYLLLEFSGSIITFCYNLVALLLPFVKISYSIITFIKI